MVNSSAEKPVLHASLDLNAGFCQHKLFEPSDVCGVVLRSAHVLRHCQLGEAGVSKRDSTFKRRQAFAFEIPFGFEPQGRVGGELAALFAHRGAIAFEESAQKLNVDGQWSFRVHEFFPSTLSVAGALSHSHVLR